MKKIYIVRIIATLRNIQKKIEKTNDRPFNSKRCSN